MGVYEFVAGSFVSAGFDSVLGFVVLPVGVDGFFAESVDCCFEVFEDVLL